jgi:phosphoserine aminotransferase
MATKSRRVFNFAAGPAMLPEPVLEQAQAEMLDWKGSGMSVMEVSHRGSDFVELAARSEATLRELLGVSNDYYVLFLAGGATLQFASIPLNIAPVGSTVDYVITGSWGEKAVSEAARYATVNVAANGAPGKFTDIPAPSAWKVSDKAAYLHYTPNETIVGVEFHYVPEVSDAPLVADMSSTILSRPVDVSKFGIIYAGAQKNIGAAGLAVLIVRKDLVGKARRVTPGIVDFKTMAESDSMWNTPPTYPWYIAALVFDWIKAEGGVEALAIRNRRKAEKLYAAIDRSGFYRNPVKPDCRSWMNVPFTLPDEKLDKPFLQQAEAAGLTNLSGHRLVGGMRASIYNAMPEAGIDALIAFMEDFARKQG